MSPLSNGENRGNPNFAVVTFAVDFWQLPKAIFLLDFRRSSYKISASAKNFTFGNCQKSTAKVTTAKYGFPENRSSLALSVLELQQKCPSSSYF